MDHIDSDRPGRKTTAQLEANRNLAKLFGQQGGMASVEQLVERGLTQRSVAHRRRTGRYYELAPGVVSLTPSPMSNEGKRWLATLGSPPDAAFGFLTAAADLELDDGSPHLHVVHLGGGRRPIRGVVRHRTTHLPERDVMVVRRHRTTKPPRTLLDCASMVDEDRLNKMLDRAVALKRYDAHAFERVMSDRPTAPGVGRLRRAIARLDATAGEHRSEFERKTTDLVRESTRISMPVVNVLAEGYRPDLYWLRSRAIVECDGRDYHRSPAQIASDAAREIVLLARGYAILRLRWHQVVYEPGRTLARIENFVLANLDAPVPGVRGRIAF